MIKTVIYTIIHLTLSPSFADNGDMPLHYEADCVSCHEQMVSGNAEVLYTRKDRLAKNYQQLEQRVYYCQEQLALDWNETQIRTVVEYLAKTYYDYPIP